MTSLPTSRLQILHTGLASATNKGAALEDFCAEFFGSIPGITIAERNALSDAHSQEIDIVLDNDRTYDGLDMLGDPLFVEAKNWSKPVGSAEVAWFDWKLRLGGIRDGFLVAANGITGSRGDGTSARAIVKQAAIEQRTILVVTPDELVACTTSDSLRNLIRTKRRQTATGQAPF